MADIIIDITGRISSYPYVMPNVVVEALAAEKAAEEAGSGSGSGGSSGGGGSGSGGGSGGGGAGGLEWNKMNIPTVNLDPIVKPLDKFTKFLDKIVKLIDPILSFIELFMNTFNSFSKIVQAILNLAKKSINELAGGAKVGAYVNILVPPAFQDGVQSNFDISKMSSGGFKGFLSRMSASLYDTKDNQRPFYGPEGQVGGMIFAVDSESLDQFFVGMKQFASFFDYVKLFRFDLAPPPPTNIKGRCGFFEDPDNPSKSKFGIILEWQGKVMPGLTFAVSRSRVRGGEGTVVPFAPTSLTGEDGLFTVIKNRFAAKDYKWPEKVVWVYKDMTFNKGTGNPVIVKANINGGGTYVDFDIPMDASGLKPGAETPVEVYYTINAIASANTKAVYTPEEIAAESPSIIGPRSSELKVALKFCDDSVESTSVILHDPGTFEFIAPGFGGMGKWTQVQVTAMIPFMPDLAEMLNSLLDSMMGMTANSSDAFGDFIDQIKEKIETYVDMLNTLNQVVQEIKKFIIGPSVSFLYVPPDTGGTAGFISRVNAATVPNPPFSGPKGVTAGVVLMFGYSPLGLSDTTKKLYETQFKLLKTTFGTLNELFS